MKVCVLQPDYSLSTDKVHFNPSNSLYNLSHLLPEDEVDYVFLNKATTYHQLKPLKRQGYDIFVNLCTGNLEDHLPSIDVIIALNQLNLPCTGSNFDLYAPDQELMKYVAYIGGVETPKFVKAETLTDVENALQKLNFPVLVKPINPLENLEINDSFYITTKENLYHLASERFSQSEAILIDEYIGGREFTVLVVGNPENQRSPITYPAIEFIFPREESCKISNLRIRNENPHRNIPCDDLELDFRLQEAAKNIFLAFHGVGYACLKFRVNEQNEILFLSINFKPSVFSPQNLKTSVDYILSFAPGGQSEFLKQIIAEGIARFKRNSKNFKRCGNAISGYGIYAERDIKRGELVIQWEETPKRIITRSRMQSDWGLSEQEELKQYGVPISDELIMYWDETPATWTPMNHSCEPNIGFNGLNIYALRDLQKGEELTLDYATFCNEDFPEFQCQCGSPRCQKIIRGTPGNFALQQSQNFTKYCLKELNLH